MFTTKFVTCTVTRVTVTFTKKEKSSRLKREVTPDVANLCQGGCWVVWKLVNTYQVHRERGTRDRQSRAAQSGQPCFDSSETYPAACGEAQFESEAEAEYKHFIARRSR